MAQFKFEVPKELMQTIQQLEKESPEICEKMIDAGLDVAYKAIESKVPVADGGLKRSLKKTKPKISKSGDWFGNLRFMGYDSTKISKRHPKGTPNALKAAVYEYGKPGQPARPFLRPAMQSAETEITAAMQKVYDEEVKKIDT